MARTFDAIEERQVAQRTIKRPSQNGAEIDDLLGPVVEGHAQSIRSDDLEAADAINQMGVHFYLRWR